MKKESKWISLLLDNNGFIVVNKAIIKILGLDNSVLLGELISEYNYYEKIGGLTEKEWFYSTTQNIEEQTGLFRKTIEKCLNKLRDEELINIKIVGMPRKRYIKINFKKIESYLKKSIIVPTSRDKNTNKQGQKSLQVGIKIPTSKDENTNKQGQKSLQVGIKIPTSKDENTNKQGQKSLQVGTKDTLNNNNITIINNNNKNNLILSNKKNGDEIRGYEYPKFINKIDLKELYKLYISEKNKKAILENVLDIIKDVYETDKKHYFINGNKITNSNFKVQLDKYNYEIMSYLIDSLANNNTKIKNVMNYTLSAIYNAPKTIDLYYNNVVKNDESNVLDKKDNDYEKLFLEKSAQGVYRSAR